MATAETQEQTISQKLARLNLLNHELAGIQVKLEERDRIKKELDSVEKWELVDAQAKLTPVIVEKNGDGKKRNTKSVEYGEPDPELWKAIKKKHFKEGKAGITAETRRQIAMEHKVDLSVVNGTLKQYADGAFRGPNSGTFTEKKNPHA